MCLMSVDRRAFALMRRAEGVISLIKNGRLNDPEAQRLLCFSCIARRVVCRCRADGELRAAIEKAGICIDEWQEAVDAQTF